MYDGKLKAQTIMKIQKFTLEEWIYSLPTNSSVTKTAPSVHNERDHRLGRISLFREADIIFREKSIGRMNTG